LQWNQYWIIIHPSIPCVALRRLWNVSLHSEPTNTPFLRQMNAEATIEERQLMHARMRACVRACVHCAIRVQ